MYQLQINDLTFEQFLAQYWQKKPLLIKQGFRDFEDPIEPEELAGLATEECIESRIVTNHNNNWEAHHGPFEQFDLLTDSNSTLLVQAVDHWHPQAAQLIEAFRFIPNWRIDDLMISFSTPGGGVGPHLDQYDVFIIQGQGKRHWRVGERDNSLKQFARNKSLLQVEQFEAVIDAVLEPGDILYIPPACPHEGYAVEDALNYSVGFRAPDQKDLLSSFADHVIDMEAGKRRFSDPELQLRASIGEVTCSDQQQIKSLLNALLEDKALYSQWLGKTLSEPKHEMDLAPLEPIIDPQELLEIAKDNPLVYRAGGVRAIYQICDDHILFSVNGENYELDHHCLDAVKQLSDHVVFEFNAIIPALNSLEFKQTLTKLINDGTYFVEDSDPADADFDEGWE
ncbi:cupin domain-containing protein [Pseudoalteromonas sp. JC3]|uniref:ribosomal protein uL16 3-hydroxylase n=1 Tax=Pseudoalteromonas sp. JC3 TaxID=2810196 RepID=UPI0019D308A4|nr:cupin domain-containing protein [Pseudoalteromonas sp. JC3]MBR8843613.1 cupin domain-containing protein [Pseudoalteromonas sp. JC3]WJE07280.1 cupin domain-containing protein [Pseudoalteromonas sp. JC3]